MKAFRSRLLRSSLASMLLTLACGPAVDEDDPGPLQLTCDELAQGRALADRRDEGVDYILDCVAFIEGELTIDPGVAIEFRPDSGLKIDGSGALNARGTLEKPIVFTGSTAARGTWRGVYIGSNNPKNVLDRVTIEHAGGNSFNSNDDRGGIVLYAGGKLTLTNSVIRENLHYGLIAYDDTSLTFENNTFTKNEKEPLSLPASLLHQLDGVSKLTGNDRDYVRITSAEVSGVEATWRRLTVPYRSEIQTGGILYVTGGSRITIEPGTELRFSADEGLAVTNGALIAKGTAEARIRFLGETETPKAWRGIFFESNDRANLLDYVEIAHAGSSGFNSNENVGGVIVYANGFAKVSNSVIRDSGTCGISAEYASSELEEAGNEITGVDNTICSPK